MSLVGCGETPHRVPISIASIFFAMKMMKAVL